MSARYQYIKAASEFKTTETSVKDAIESKKTLERRNWAQEENLNPDESEEMNRDLIESYIQD